MARSSRRFGAKMPGVSTKMICAAPSSAMPRTSVRVVCTLRETIVTLAPTSWLSSVDFPALGAPISAHETASAESLATSLSSFIASNDAFAFQKILRAGLFGEAFGTVPRPGPVSNPLTLTSIDENRRVIGA